MVQFEKKAGRPMPGPFPMFRKGKLEEKGESAVSSDGEARNGEMRFSNVAEIKRASTTESA
jgi:hypothetical protein